MKKLTIILILALLLGSLAAQEMAWINPNLLDGTNFPDLGQDHRLPDTMLAVVSRGIFYDEWDTVFRAPAELSNYKGINLLTAYGNYAGWAKGTALPTPATVVNPFTTATFDAAPFVIGVSMPVLGIRAAALTGFKFISAGSVIGDRNGDGVNLGNEKFSNVYVADGAGTIGTVDYTTNYSYNFTDYSQRGTMTFGGGADLGFIGASAYVIFDSETRMVGGSENYTYTAGESAVPANNTSALSVNYVSENGAVKMIGSDTAFDTGKAGIVAELPVPNFPITAELNFSWSSNLLGTASPFTAAQLPSYHSVTLANLTGNPAMTSTATWTTAATASTGWNAAFVPGATVAVGQLFTNGNTYVNSNCLDLGGSSYSDFTSGIVAGVDPVIMLPNNIKLVTRAKVGYNFGIIPAKTSYQAAYAYRQSVDANAANDIQYNMTYSYTASSNTFTNKINSELGGVFEFTGAGGNLVLGTGFFATPNFIFESTSTGTSTESRTTSYHSIDATPDMIALATPAAVYAQATSGVATKGTAGYTLTSTDPSVDRVNTYNLDFVFPFSAKIVFPKPKMQLIGGYDIRTTLQYSETIDETRPTTATFSNITLTNNAGANVYAPAAVATSAAATTSKVTSGGWEVPTTTNNMSFMLRWDPLSCMTVDFLGTSVMNALNFSILGGGAGFNASAFISNLSMSVTFHF
jgi:hypothetical protein